MLKCQRICGEKRAKEYLGILDKKTQNLISSPTIFTAVGNKSINFLVLGNNNQLMLNSSRHIRWYMDTKSACKLFLLKKPKSVHWFLFGIDIGNSKAYILEINGNVWGTPKVFTINNARKLWSTLRIDTFEMTSLRDAGNIPSQVLQRIREWWHFVHHGLTGNDPWRVWHPDKINEKDSQETLQEIASGFIKEPTNLNESNWADWDYSEPIYNDEGRTCMPSEDSDNYWNQEGVFEAESDIHDY